MLLKISEKQYKLEKKFPFYDIKYPKVFIE
jgi:hypothetical protein